MKEMFQDETGGETLVQPTAEETKDITTSATTHYRTDRMIEEDATIEAEEGEVGEEAGASLDFGELLVNPRDPPLLETDEIG